MNIALNLKLIVRSWWRNKIHFFISLFSLTIGLTCTNLLITFFIHEYNVESSNPERENIYILRQDSPMEVGEKVTFTNGRVVSQIKNSYAEIASMLRIGVNRVSKYEYQGNELPRPLALEVDSTLTEFFPYEVAEGSLHEVLTTPGKVALSADYARQIFGAQSGMGEIIETLDGQKNRKSYQVAAILKERAQSFLKFDLLMGTQDNFVGGAALLKLPTGTNIQALQQKIRDDKVPTLMPGKTQYYIQPIKDIYFGQEPNSKQEPLTYLHQTNVQLLYIALASALLVLVIACFNYSNLNLSRTLQQVKMIHIEKLMGAKLKEIRMQLFLDAMLTVVLSFLLALLLLNDILPWFNELLSVQLSYSFFFSGQVLPLLLCFIFILAVVPGLYISHRLSRQSLSDFRLQYTGRNKQHLIGVLVTLQFILSIALIYATTLAQSQLGLMRQHANRYENMIEIGDMFSGPAQQPFQQKLANIQGIESTTLSSNSILSGFIMQFSIPQEDGTEAMRALTFIHSDSTFFPAMKVRVLKGMTPQEALSKYDSPFYINENYARWTNIRPEDIGVKKKKDINPQNFPQAENVLAGIIENIPTNSLQEEIMAQEITLHETGDPYLSKNGMFIQIRIKPDKREETIASIKQMYEETFEGRDYIFMDMHQMFLDRNKELVQMSQILNAYSLIALLLTCFGVFGISWHAVRQRTREIAIRQIHGASLKNILWLLNRPFVIQILIAYVIAIPLGGWMMQPWLEQFTIRTEHSLGQFLWPLATISIVSCITVSIHTFLTARNNPTQSLKTE